MKYNPKINERVAALPGLRGLHPYEPEDLVQGALELMDTLSLWLAEIAGLARTTLQPAAGAHGELTGLLLVRAYHEDRGGDAAHRAHPRHRPRHQPGVGGDGRLRAGDRCRATPAAASTSRPSAAS